MTMIHKESFLTRKALSKRLLLYPPSPSRLFFPSMEQENHKTLHVVMFPWLAMGHLIPFLHLSKCLASTGHKITFISTPRNLSRLPKLPPFLSHLIHLLPLPLPQVPGLPEQAESSLDIPHQKAQILKIAFDLLKEPISHCLEKSTPKPDWIIYDYASHWLPSISAKFNIPCAFFSLFNAANLAFIGPPYALLSQDYARTTAEDFTIVPSWVPFDSNIVYKRHEVAKYMEGSGDEGIKSELSDDKRFGVCIGESDVVLTRTCVEFEPDWFNLICELYQKRVIPVGFLPPSLVHDFEPETCEKWLEIKNWLDKKPVDSVVYVALGTEATLSQDELTELALGLEKSGLNFFWVMRKSPGSTRNPVEMLPDGFTGRVEDRGWVYLDWAPQGKILSHPGIGGFLTHCGWNSVIEGLSVGRVLIMFPVMNDQGLNARLLGGKGLGLEIVRAESDGSFVSDSVAESIRLAMVEEEGESFRANAREMKGLFGDKCLNSRCVDNLVRYLEENRKFE